MVIGFCKMEERFNWGIEGKNLREVVRKRIRGEEMEMGVIDSNVEFYYKEDVKIVCIFFRNDKIIIVFN